MTNISWRRICWGVILVGLCIQVFSLVYYVLEQRVLGAYDNRVVSASSSPSEQAKEIVLSLKNKSADDNNAYFLLPVFRFLRPTARQVIENGGDCADRSRLVIRLLRIRGIHASKWALYDARGESVHAVVQADVETGKMVVDPLFGIWFPRPQEGYYAIEDLRQDPSLLLKRISELKAVNARPGAARLDFYPTDEYVYTNARTINWSKSFLLRTCYSLLRGIMGKKVDEINRPALAEEPPLMVMYGIAVFQVLLALIWLFVAGHSRKASRKSRVAESVVSAG